MALRLPAGRGKHSCRLVLRLDLLPVLPVRYTVDHLKVGLAQVDGATADLDLRSCLHKQLADAQWVEQNLVVSL